MKRILVISVFTALCLQPIVADDLADVDKITRDTVGAVLESLRDQSADYETRFNQFKQIINPVFDFDRMGKQALGKTRWSRFKADQKREYLHLFGDLLRQTYFDKMSLFSSVAVEYQAPIRVKSHVHLPMVAVSKSERQGMLYKLYSKNGQWKVWHVEVQDISIVKSYKAQYRQFLTSGSVEDLLKKMRASVGK